MTDQEKKEMAELKARVAELEKQNKPKPPEAPYVHRPIDYTAAASMPPAAMRELAEAMPAMNGAKEAAALSAVAVGRQPVVQSQDRGQRGLNTTGWRDPAPPPHFGQSFGDKMTDNDLKRRRG